MRQITEEERRAEISRRLDLYSLQLKYTPGAMFPYAIIDPAVEADGDDNNEDGKETVRFGCFQEVSAFLTGLHWGSEARDNGRCKI